jgi:hypothetical protein
MTKRINNVIVLKYNFPFEKEIAELLSSYALRIFYDQAAVSNAYTDDGEYVYLTKNFEKKRLVTCDNVGKYHCDCGFPAMRGLICRHVIRRAVISQVPSILRDNFAARWYFDQIPINLSSSLNNDPMLDLHVPSNALTVTNHFSNIQSLFKAVAVKYSDTPHYTALEIWAQRMLEGNIIDIPMPVETIVTDTQHALVVRDPPIVATKGRRKKSTKAFKSAVGKSSSRRQQNSCKQCGQLGHNTATCKK